MKTRLIFGVIVIAFLFMISGCSQENGEVVDEDTLQGTAGEGGPEQAEETDEDATEDIVEEVEDTAENLTEETDVKELIKELSEEAGLDTENMTEEEEETEVEEEATAENRTVVIDNYKGVPSDFSITAGTTVTFMNEQENFKHIVGIRKWEGTRYPQTTVDGDYHPVLPGDSWSYTFEEAGKYQWLSKSNYPDTSGEITVIE